MNIGGIKIRINKVTERLSPTINTREITIIHSFWKPGVDEDGNRQPQKCLDLPDKVHTVLIQVWNLLPNTARPARQYGNSLDTHLRGETNLNQGFPKDRPIWWRMDMGQVDSWGKAIQEKTISISCILYSVMCLKVHFYSRTIDKTGTRQIAEICYWLTFKFKDHYPYQRRIYDWSYKIADSLCSEQSNSKYPCWWCIWRVRARCDA